MIDPKIFAAIVAAVVLTALACWWLRLEWESGAHIPGFSDKEEPVDIHTKKPGKVFYSHNPGFENNPFLKWPRNSLCFCGNKRKFKECCLKNQPRVLPHGKAEVAKIFMRHAEEYRKTGGFNE